MNVSNIDPGKEREARDEVLDIVVERWSPRAMSGEPVSEEDLKLLFDAARWAPSSYNNQPWRFVYARRDTEHWDRLFDLLVDFNQKWCRDAGALLVILSRKEFEDRDKPARTHSFDSGAAWQNLQLQGRAVGLVVHGMEGFDYDRAREVLGVPDVYQVEAMAAVGHPGDAGELPDGMQEKEKPSDRKPVSEIAFEGKFEGR